jgi:alanyl-tRNA synthetase
VPLDFIEDLAGERGLTIDREGFDRAMAGQRERARAASAFDTKGGDEFTFADEQTRAALAGLADAFEGYAGTDVEDVQVVAAFDESRRQVAALPAGRTGWLVLARTPFYVEAGGQVSDTGEIVATGRSDGTARVEGMGRLAAGGPRVHRVRVTRGEIAAGQLVTARVDAGRRDAIRRNHTATHLLHAALRQVLGPHVKQAGSLVAPDRLRFDFQHPAPLGPEDLAQIERRVNEQIYRNAPVETQVMATSDAIAQGAMALFGEKYGDRVRVVTVPDFSRELCGGTHCRATGDIGPFIIVSEGGVAAGVRRVEALTGGGAVALLQERAASLSAILGALNAPPDQAVASIERLQQDVKRLQRENSELKVRAAMAPSRSAADNGGQDVAGVKLIARRTQGLDKSALRALSDSLRDGLGSGVVVIASETDEGKVALVVSVTKDLTGRVRAGDLVKQLAPLIGGGGGGRPDLAEAGGRDPARIDALLAEAPAVLARQLDTSRG